MLFYRKLPCLCVQISEFFFFYFSLLTEKAALLSPDEEVQKSDISSSSQGLVEKEALGPMLLEVNNTHTISRDGNRWSPDLITMITI